MNDFNLIKNSSSYKMSHITNNTLRNVREEMEKKQKEEKKTQAHYKTQCEKIVEFMENYGSITQRQAEYFGCMRLASRIHDLKKQGVKIISETLKVQNLDGSYSYVGRYRLQKDEVKDD